MPRLLILFSALSLLTLPGAYAADPPAKRAGKPAAKSAGKPAAKSAAKKPAKRAVRKPRKGRGVTGKPKNPNPPVIGPKGEKGPETGFTLSKIPKRPGLLSLAFVTRNTNLTLNTKTGLVAQFFSDEEIEVDPSIVTSQTWPKNSDRLQLKYKVKNAKKGQEYEVQGQIAYTVCHRKTNVCEPRRSIVYVLITP